MIVMIIDQPARFSMVAFDFVKYAYPVSRNSQAETQVIPQSPMTAGPESPLISGGASPRFRA